MPARVTTSIHMARSLAMKAANSCADPVRTSAPSLPSAATISADLRLSLMAALSLATMVADVPAGATTPVNVSATKSGMPPSIMVGKSGASALRVALATPSARIFPARTSGSRPATSPDRRAHHQGAGIPEQQRVAVGLGARDRFGAERAAGAGAILDDHGLPEDRPEALNHEPRRGVDRPSRRVGHHHLDQPVRIGLRLDATGRAQHRAHRR